VETRSRSPALRPRSAQDALSRLTSDGRVEFLRWSSIDLVRKNAPLLVYRPERGKPVCAFLDEERAPTASEIESAFARAPSDPEPLKPWSVAVGVFLEFLLFLESSGDADYAR
jgi:hypothetical protein